jgi:hypothetical protein
MAEQSSNGGVIDLLKRSPTSRRLTSRGTCHDYPKHWLALRRGEFHP